ncbi:hypothetical protein Clacol_002594 [Clathrus columnatus]|uniref:DUF202 domain-containing protein n=1 Tax=Clathrus columnatus TaxID=1419009 RepID=A0AAV5A905_9AGAM|nr:hypothetical protein Clacol_002594 [Clathrus columnatus]
MSANNDIEENEITDSAVVSHNPWNSVKRWLSPGSLSLRDLLFPTGNLPKNPEGVRQRAMRADRIPETEEDEDGQRPTVRDYHSINAIPPQVRVPKKIPTPIQVESKVWFANERTWVAYLNVAMLLGTLALALFNASRDQIALNFAYTYAVISVGIVVISEKINSGLAAVIL